VPSGMHSATVIFTPSAVDLCKVPDDHLEGSDGGGREPGDVDL
jgi:hypothetical protein